MAKRKKRSYFQNPRTGEKIRYIQAEELKEKHPSGDYVVIGEYYAKEKSDGEIEKALLNGKGKNIYAYPVGNYKEQAYKTVGYIPCEGDEYIALKKKKRTKLIASLIILLLLLLGLGLGYFMMSRNKMPDIDPNAGEYTSALKRPENIDESKILIPGYGKFTINKGSKTIDTVLFNPEDNPCYFKFTLVEKETGDVLYESKLVPPGQGITPIEINKSYKEVGTYPAILKFETVDFEDTDITYNGSEMEVDLNVVE